MSNENLPMITSFVIRFVEEKSDTSENLKVWRGAIQHVQSEQALTFAQWEDALDFMQRFLSPEIFNLSSQIDSTKIENQR